MYLHVWGVIKCSYWDSDILDSQITRNGNLLYEAVTKRFPQKCCLSMNYPKKLL